MPFPVIDQQLIKTAFRLVLAVLFALFLGGCGAPTTPTPAANPNPAPTGPVATGNPTVALAVTPVQAEAERPDVMSVASLSGLNAQAIKGPIELVSARNEWVSTVVQISPISGPAVLELPAIRSASSTIDPKQFKAYQVLPVKVDVNRAGFVRQTGLPAAVESLPRALLPLPIENGRIDLARCRHPQKPADTSASALGSNEPILIWLDLQIPTDAAAGAYRSVLTLADPTSAQLVANQPNLPRPPIATLRLSLEVLDFVLSDDRHLVMVAQVAWDSLKRHWPERFEVIQPNLLSRTDRNHTHAVATIDELQRLAQAHRAQIHIPRLQPTVKWPALKPPQIDWSEYDGILKPWMTGSAFPDQVPLGYWPLPKIDYLDNILLSPRLEYYAAAASHFDQLDWLRRAPVLIDKLTPGRATLDERIAMSAEAQRVIASHPRVRVQMPLELDEVQIADDRNANLIDPRATGRLNCVAPGLISSSPLRKWPENLTRPETFLRTDLRGLIPYAGAGGDQSDVRVWAWVAFLRNARVIEWGNCLPATPNLNEPADPGEITWFYPGSWFGTDQIVPTVQLKWMRRAQQDFEYLYLARERGSAANVLPMVRVLAKPVEIQANQTPDPTYSLLLGTADPIAWRDAFWLLGRTVMIREPGAAVDENKLANLNLDTFKWIEPIEKPVILPRTTQWTVGAPEPGFVGPWVNLRLGIDIYNASDTNLEENKLGFDVPAKGWLVQPAPVTIPKLTVYQVQRHPINARVDPLRTPVAKHEPVTLGFRSGYSGRQTPVEFVAPVTRSLRRTAPLRMNGSLDDWTAYDAIQLGPLVKLMSRPAMQQHELEMASTETQIYSGWTDTDLFFAFRVEGLSKNGSVLAARNFVDYQYGRAWGEDLCQVVVQAVYEDGTTGPLVHAALKPGGNVWVERKLDPRLHVNPWENFNPNPMVRYVATLEPTVWRGELAIPWPSLIAESKTDEFARQGKPNLPVMLKFNFVQHKRDTGESASWAGPIDIGRDDSFTGVIVLKEAERSDTPDSAR